MKLKATPWKSTFCKITDPLNLLVHFTKKILCAWYGISTSHPFYRIQNLKSTTLRSLAAGRWISKKPSQGAHLLYPLHLDALASHHTRHNLLLVWYITTTLSISKQPVASVPPRHLGGLRSWRRLHIGWTLIEVRSRRAWCNGSDEINGHLNETNLWIRPINLSIKCITLRDIFPSSS